ncbi:MAG: hypothetical protein QOE51_1624 [Actinoplanes sp.]|jgi:hypothetical protein|nr:hypothetical protein [Actinoplanes sp.]
MSETGWPLIPRELLPAPVEAARRAKRPPAYVDGARQLSIFGAETTEASPADLAGLLAGPGRIGRMGGTARVSIAVDAAWRVHVLVGELMARGLVVNWLPVDQHQDQDHGRDQDHGQNQDQDQDESQNQNQDQDQTDLVRETVPDEGNDPIGGIYEVRTAYSSRLNGLARAWPPPAGRLFLSGPRLRLWVAAAGRPAPGGYALGIDPVDNPEIADSALVRAGLAGTVSDQGRYYLISGRKRLRRLAELVGERPAAAPEQLWPSGATA